MKTFIIVSVMMAAFGRTIALAGAEDNNVSSKIELAQASNDVQSVMMTLPEVENLWPQNPELFFQLAKESANVLSTASNRPDAKQAMLNLFTNMVQKNASTNEDVYFNQERDAILYFLNFETITSDKSSLVALAHFLGEVRSRRILNYSNRGTGLPGHDILAKAGVLDASLITNVELKEAYEKAVEANKQDLMMNDLQMSLMESDRILTFHLLNYCARFPSSDPTNADFIRKISSAAHLTEDEQRQLQ